MLLASLRQKEVYQAWNGYESPCENDVDHDIIARREK